MTVRNDRYGFFPLYYSFRNGELALSPSIPKLLLEGTPADIDDAAVGILYRLGHLLGNDTPFAAVRVVPPDAQMVWENGQLDFRDGYVLHKEQLITRAAAIDGFVELFRLAVRRRPAVGPSAVPLSGGRDSRHILLELCHSGAPPSEALTVRYRPNVKTEDVEVAAALSARCGVPHTVLEEPSDLVRPEWRKNLQTSFCALEHQWIIPMEDYVRGRFTDVYEGVGGDILATAWPGSRILRSPDPHAASLRLQKEVESGNCEYVADMLLAGDDWLSKSLRKDRFRRASRDQAKARFVEEFRRHLGAANPLGSFFFYNRARRVTGLASTAILGRAATTWCPYLDADLSDFLASVPPRTLIDTEYHRFHTEAIHRAFPKYADIPFAGKVSARRRAPALEKHSLAVLTHYLLDGAKSEMLRRSFLVPRVLRSYLDPEYRKTAVDLARFCLYLLQLERYAIRRTVSGSQI